MSEPARANYSRLDRLLHRLAFANLEIQKSLADLEDRMHAKRIESITTEKAVFITALPRAGTTLILDVLARDPGFATHTYRCMPFVLCPLLWDSISRGFRRPGDKRERMHGDGMTVSYDSPEAFEEVLWKAFSQKKYRAGTVGLWTEEDRNPEFEEFFDSHIRKLIALSGATSTAASRYISKNNANIARIPLLKRMFSDAIFIIPFREPLNQAASLLRQHARFTKIHSEDTFARDYMDDIGHFEFGGGLRIIDFPAIDDSERPADPMTEDFWLTYWIRAYRFLIQQSQRHASAVFVDFDKFCAAPLQSLTMLCGRLGCVKSLACLEAAAADFHPAVRYDTSKLGFAPSLVARAKALHAELSSYALNWSSVEPSIRDDALPPVTKLSRAHTTDS